MAKGEAKPEEGRSHKDGELTLTLSAGAAEAAGSGVRRMVDDAPDLGEASQLLSFRERITLRGLHSSGGIGEVWRAYDEVIGREIALKRLQNDHSVNESTRARFAREAKITGQLEHPGIVPVYDYSAGEAGGHCFYTMRFVRGQTLREVVVAFHGDRKARAAPLVGGGLLSLLNHFTTICKTMAFAHSRGVIHRDLKGDNVIVGGFGEVLVLDWGLAKRIGDPEGSESEAPESSPEPAPRSPVQTLQGQQLGTPAYMAPEQALGRIDLIDHRTDVYGLAAILYEILTGRPPFLGEKLDSVLQQVVKAPPIPPNELVPGVPPELERICLRGLSKAAADRPQSAHELGAAVEAWLTTLAERKRIEQERERFFDLSTDLLAIVDREGRLGQTNAAWLEQLGWELGDQAPAPTFLSLVAEADRARARAQLGRLGTELERVAVELRMRCASGTVRIVDWSARTLPDDLGLYLVGRDVTDRRRSEQEVEGLIESAPDAMCVIDAEGTLVRVNAQLERLLGRDRAELLGQPVEILLPEHLRERHRGHVAGYVRSPRTRPMGTGLQLVGYHADGTQIPVEVSLSPVETEQRLLISCTLRDVRERHKAQRALAAVLEAAPDAMITIDRHQRIQLVNRRVIELFGYTRDELVGASIEVLVPERLRGRHADHVAAFIADPSPRSMTMGRTLHGQHEDGTEFPVEVSLSPVETDDGLLIACAIRPSQA